MSSQLETQRHSPPSSPISDIIDSPVSSPNTSFNASIDSEADQNFISLLQYDDAYHILGLTPKIGGDVNEGNDNAATGTNDLLSPDEIFDAYTSLKEQALAALDHCEAMEKQPSPHNAKTPPRRGGSGIGAGSFGASRNAFFVSQKNYLELKLQALDQAVLELMPIDDERMGQIDFGGTSLDFDDENDISGDVMGMPDDEILDGMHDRNVPTMLNNRLSAGENRETKTSRVPVDRNHAKQSENLSHRKRAPSEDELDTIDIYFKPAGSPGPNPLQSTNRERSNNATLNLTQSDVSSCTWEGSSEFSDPRRLNTSQEDVSDGELSDLLGPMSTSSNSKSQTITQKIRAVARANQRRSPFSRPPISRNSKIVKPPQQRQAQVSPRGVSEIFEDDERYFMDDKTKLVNRGRRGPRFNFNPSQKQQDKSIQQDQREEQSMGESKQHPLQSHQGHSATEAARMGVLRALSEDDSECLPLDDDSEAFNNDVNSTSQTFEKPIKNLGNINEQGNGENSSTNQHTESSNAGNFAEDASAGGNGLAKAKRLFSATTDKISNDNSLIESEMPYKGMMVHRQDSPNSSPGSRKSRSSNPNRGLTSPALDPPRSSDNTKLATAPQIDNQEFYDNIFQSGMELADELCGAFQNCWSTIAAIPGEECSNVGEGAESSTRPTEEDATTLSSWITRSTEDEESTAFYTRGDESTAFNTKSTFSKSSHSPTSARKVVFGDRSETKARMLV